ncbi:aldose 1-epimerase [Paraburkholderia aspalathi]|jgi:aldose 1-epimerase|uniref:Aldose 1-epimerase n=1 Tax=Paraburkholderia aspalathi TaxID=1324617 RepID=A0A1I7DAD0_9BURK|nr:aldose 1-epimerase [Paraburkholderia aspalathi]
MRDTTDESPRHTARSLALPMAHADALSESRVRLASETLEAELVPGWGGRLARLRSKVDGYDLVAPIEQWTAEPFGWPRRGAYPLIPYSNRIAHARLAVLDQVVALPPHPLSAPHTLHGVCQILPWQCVAQTQRHAKLCVDYAGAEWPWAIHAEQTFELAGSELTLRLAVENRADTPMPAGLGWHPYFCVKGGSVVSFEAGQKWTIGADYLPDGARTQLDRPVVVRGDDWSTGDYAGYFSEWTGQAVLSVAGGSLEMHVSEPLSHLVVFAPAGADFVCIEPVSHVANAFNLAHDGVKGTGHRMLDPGESMQAMIRLHWKPTDRASR